MKILSFNDFMKKYILKNDSTNESELQTVYKYKIYLEILKISQMKDS